MQSLCGLGGLPCLLTLEQVFQKPEDVWPGAGLQNPRHATPCLGQGGPAVWSPSSSPTRRACRRWPASAGQGRIQGGLLGSWLGWVRGPGCLWSPGRSAGRALPARHCLRGQLRLLPDVKGMHQPVVGPGPGSEAWSAGRSATPRDVNEQRSQLPDVRLHVVYAGVHIVNAHVGRARSHTRRGTDRASSNKDRDPITHRNVFGLLHGSSHSTLGLVNWRSDAKSARSHAGSGNPGTS